MDQFQEHLDHSMNGNKKINPDEQNFYLGTFRERILTVMTLKQLADPTNLNNLTTEIKTNNNLPLFIKINGNLATDLQSKYMSLANKNNLEFTIVNNHIGNSPDSIGLVLHTNTAVNQEKIDLAELFPVSKTNENNSKEETPKKKSFFSKLFH